MLRRTLDRVASPTSPQHGYIPGPLRCWLSGRSADPGQHPRVTCQDDGTTLNRNVGSMPAKSWQVRGMDLTFVPAFGRLPNARVT